jgi:hypothetical protein
LSITLTAATFAYATITVHVVQGMNNTRTSVLDTYNFPGAEGAASQFHTGPSITTTNAYDYIFTWWGQDSTNNVNVTDNNTGFTKWTENFDYIQGGPCASFDDVVAATGTYSQKTITSLPTLMNSVIAAFKIGAIINSFTASPTAGVTSGSAVTLSWAGQATTWTIDNGVGVVAGNSVVVYPTVDTTYTLTASGLSTSSDTAQVTVKIAAPAFQLNAFQNDAFFVSSGVTYNATTMFLTFF